MLAFAAVAALSVPAPAGAATITPTTFADDNAANGNCTLREAIIAANGNFPVDGCATGTGADEIPLQAGTYELSVPVAGEDFAATGDLDITDPAGLKITGHAAGSTVDANSIDRVFHVREFGNATLDPLTITGGNSAADGGGIAVQDNAVVTVLRTTVSGNSAIGGADAGGIDVNGPAGKANVIESTVSGNTASSDGGGLDVHSGGDADITNSTISGNQASPISDTGGGLRASGAGTVVNVVSSTIAGNGANFGGGMGQTANATLSVRDSIVANNTGATAPDCSGTLTSQGYNLVEALTGCVLVSQPTDITGQDPQLGALADNGGPTQTMAIAMSSPALDQGSSGGLTTDQRGLARPYDFPVNSRLAGRANAAGGDGADIGALELAPRCRGKEPTIVARPGQVTVGTSGADVIVGTSRNDVILAGDGRDTICGFERNDRLNGGGGKDTADGSTGKDRLIGAGGNDLLLGKSGKDRIQGAKGRDRISGARGNDRLFGGKGKDRISGARGKDRLNGGKGRDRLFGGSARDRLFGGKGRDRLFGGKGKDRLSGGKSKDRLNGGKGNDRLFGGAGNDSLNGGPGRDKTKQ